ncbi:MAG: hypothetical protein WC516_06485 [Patescibacteria group bacterium]|jgi:hypothetical protein
MRPLEDIEGTPFNYDFLGSKEVLVKGVEEDGKWNIYLSASAEENDSDEEITLRKALEEQQYEYIQKGVISWNHLHRSQVQGAVGFIIGEPTDVAFDADKTLVKGFLYKKNENAQKLFENLMSGSTRFGASIGGGILKRAVEYGQKYLTAVWWRDTAVTDVPVLQSTQGHVQLTPFSAFAKSLMAGSGVNPETFIGGRALQPEDMGTPVLKNSILTVIFLEFLQSMEQIKDEQSVFDFVRQYGLREDVVTHIGNYIIKNITR